MEPDPEKDNEKKERVNNSSGTIDSNSLNGMDDSTFEIESLMNTEEEAVQEMKEESKLCSCLLKIGVLMMFLYMLGVQLGPMMGPFIG